MVFESDCADDVMYTKSWFKTHTNNRLVIPAISAKTKQNKSRFFCNYFFKTHWSPSNPEIWHLELKLTRHSLSIPRNWCLDFTFHVCDELMFLMECDGVKTFQIAQAPCLFANSQVWNSRKRRKYDKESRWCPVAWMPLNV